MKRKEDWGSLCLRPRLIENSDVGLPLTRIEALEDERRDNRFASIFIGEWSEQNLHNIVKVLNCFHLASGLKINIAKSQVLGVGVSQNVVVQAANRIGCAVLNTPFRYLGVTVG
ncbi:hypothetical protein Tco_0224352, partial [Tanacetum coccineum]